MTPLKIDARSRTLYIPDDEGPVSVSYVFEISPETRKAFYNDTLHFDSRSNVLIVQGRIAIPLGATEAKIWQVLQDSDGLADRETLLNALGPTASTASLEVGISRLRESIFERTGLKPIETIRKQGYRLR